MPLFRLYVLCLFAASAAALPAQPAPLETIAPLVRVVDLNIGEHATVTLHDGSTANIALIGVEEHKEPVREAVYGATLRLRVNGESHLLDAGPYRLPVTLAGVQIDCTATRGLNERGTPAFWGLEKDARIRLWPAGSPWLQPGSMIYPIKQDWNATRTWFDNEPVHGGDAIKPSIYYHAGMDIGASEGLAEVVAATDALVVQRGEDVLPGHETDTPASPRYDVVYLLDGRGWYYRYSHLKEIAPIIQPGAVVRQGDPVGIAGKEGASGGWSHLHFEIKSRQPSGKWGTQAAFAFLHEAYVREFGLALYANAQPMQMIVAGESAVLDGSRSWSASGDIASYTWTLQRGEALESPRHTVAYDTPGFYCETLKVTDPGGESAWDFAHVMVLDPDDLTQYTPSVNINHHPARGIRPGDPITFKARAFRMEGGEESWDFGDGSPVRTTQSPEDAEPLAPEGYAEIQHAYANPGDYIVSVTRTHNNGQTATAKAWIRVLE
ncbi:MAG: peptidoglycan DD-metalloendopeptidase family protein [Candidatus Hydrogenedentes bacterium]|nr:peptidoglycan DD-metalloendopeptidase family protein [Candidatus Hydrogenedentota bacterium]